jgi:hypothetical protein
MEKLINYFRSNAENKSLARKISIIAVLATLLAGYHLFYVTETLIMVIKGKFGFNYFLLKAALVPVMVLFFIKWFLKSEFIGWFFLLFWTANIFINNLYNVWLSKFWLAKDESMIGQMEQVYSFDLLSLGINFMLYGLAIIFLISKDIRKQMGVVDIHKWMPIIIATFLFIVEIFVSSLNIWL